MGMHTLKKAVKQDVKCVWVGFHTRDDAWEFKRLDDVHGTGALREI